MSGRLRRSSRYTARLSLSAALAAVIAGCSASTGGSPTTEPSTNPSPSVRVTAAQYAQIHDGMSRAQVQAIMGWPGAVQSESSGGGTTSAVVEWQDATMLHDIIIAFVNDAVISKNAVGF